MVDLLGLRHPLSQFLQLRRLLSFYYKEGATYKIPLGPLRGLQMIYDPAMNLRAIMGLQDLPVFKLLTPLLSLKGENQTAVDLGANRGIYSLWLARNPLVQKVFSFEPNPILAEQVALNARLNQLTKIQVIKKACAERSGQLDFYLGESDSVSTLVQNLADTATPRQITVESTTLDEFFFGEGGIGKGPDFLKMDIEGGGVYALKGADRCFQESRPLCYLESHSPEEDSSIAKLIEKHDYQAFEIVRRRWITRVDQVYPDPEGVHGYLVACPTDMQDKVAHILGVRPQRWK